jgi:hypothetical protein
MNKDLYYIGIISLALSVLAGFLQSILYLLVGGSLFTFQSFMGWFLLATLISLATSLGLLKYYSFKKYRTSFLISIFSMVIGLSQQGLFYLLLSGRRDLQQYYVAIVLLSLVTAIALGCSFIFSKSAERKWLKRAGVLTLAMATSMLVLVIISILTSTMSLKISIQKVIEWIGLFANIVPFLLLLNFLDEVRETKKENTEIGFPKFWITFMGFVGMTVCSFAVVFAFSLSGESSTHLYWQGKNAEETAKVVKLGEERSFTNNQGETLKYVLIKPQGYDPTIKYPLLVALPYSGYEAPPAQFLTSGSNQYHYPTFIFIPFCPEGAGWGGIPNYPTIDTLVFDAILKVEEEMSIDVDRLYVSGVSRGGYGSWHFITTRPDMFAAAIPVCGGGDPTLAPRIINVSVWAFHGAQDMNVPVSGSRDMIAAMKKAGGEPKYTEFPYSAHNIWSEVTQTNGLWQWLFNQRRNGSVSEQTVHE